GLIEFSQVPVCADHSVVYHDPFNFLAAPAVLLPALFQSVSGWRRVVEARPVPGNARPGLRPRR
ncbi:hypothetical protein, partial [Xiamenia xianingshaonis]|uniref:hypothetical protein n=1 Tax=Xiamenia xianingshaonis TaxID=2682776 RepID=UPI0021BDEACD